MDLQIFSFICTGAKWDLRDLQSVLGRAIICPSLGLSCLTLLSVLLFEVSLFGKQVTQLSHNYRGLKAHSKLYCFHDSQRLKWEIYNIESPQGKDLDLANKFWPKHLKDRAVSSVKLDFGTIYTVDIIFCIFWYMSRNFNRCVKEAKR